MGKFLFLTGVAIGGDRYPGSVYLDHLLRYEADENVKMMVMLGEVGGRLEYDVAEAVKSGKITKPLVAWCIGTCADHITSEVSSLASLSRHSNSSSQVQFGHAGASANASSETASAKNKALAAAGCIVPPSFDDLGSLIRSTFEKLEKSGKIPQLEDLPPPAVPMDYAWARVRLL